jgi:hypothetical protein
MHYEVSQVVDMVGDNTVAAALVKGASVVGTGAAVLQIVATAEMTPRKYFAVAIVAVGMGLVVVASFIPLTT